MVGNTCVTRWLSALSSNLDIGACQKLEVEAFISASGPEDRTRSSKAALVFSKSAEGRRKEPTMNGKRYSEVLVS